VLSGRGDGLWREWDYDDRRLSGERLRKAAPLSHGGASPDQRLPWGFMLGYTLATPLDTIDHRLQKSYGHGFVNDWLDS